MATLCDRTRVGAIRPSQLLFAYGIGAIVELPNLSAIVAGLDDWGQKQSHAVVEERLLAAVQAQISPTIACFFAPPRPPEASSGMARGASPLVGIPVVPFPRWLLCPWCRRLLKINGGLVEFKRDPYRPERVRYVHTVCAKAREPTVLPARFLLACPRGHLADFPWIEFAHRGPSNCAAQLLLEESGPSGEAAEVYVRCTTCRAGRSMAEAFGEQATDALGRCPGRWPHLRAWDREPCLERPRAILLGASNSWFPLVMSGFSIPQAAADHLAGLVEQEWGRLAHVTAESDIAFLRRLGELGRLAEFDDAAIWGAIEARRQASPAAPGTTNLKVPEWEVFTQPYQERASPEFQVRAAPPPDRWAGVLERVVLVERLRVVHALVGFTRIESPGDFDELGDLPEARRAPLSRGQPRWLPAVEVRGEGIFLQFREDTLQAWVRTGVAATREKVFRDAYVAWRHARGLPPTLVAFPNLRYLLLHTFAHALIRQLALDCGYAMASLRERIYSLNPEEDDGPMSGILLYTAATDSEGTLGGLVRLGEADELERAIWLALERARLCASDPLCAEHRPDYQHGGLHGAACHTCLFVPETSCERGNKYLDRTVLVPTVAIRDGAFFHESTRFWP